MWAACLGSGNDNRWSVESISWRKHTGWYDSALKVRSLLSSSLLFPTSAKHEARIREAIEIRS